MHPGLRPDPGWSAGELPESRSFHSRTDPLHSAYPCLAQLNISGGRGADRTQVIDLKFKSSKIKFKGDFTI